MLSQVHFDLLPDTKTKAEQKAEKKNKTPPNERRDPCRFGFPRERVEGEADFQSTNDLDAAPVDVNPKASFLGWNGNCDFKFILDLEQMKEYCAKYATKDEQHTESSGG